MSCQVWGRKIFKYLFVGRNCIHPCILGLGIPNPWIINYVICMNIQFFKSIYSWKWSKPLNHMVYGIVKNNCFIKENIVILNISFIILAFQGALCPSSISTFNSGSICKYLLSVKNKTITKKFSNLNIQCGFSKFLKKLFGDKFLKFWGFSLWVIWVASKFGAQSVQLLWTFIGY